MPSSDSTPYTHTCVQSSFPGFISVYLLRSPWIESSATSSFWHMVLISYADFLDPSSRKWREILEIFTTSAILSSLIAIGFHRSLFYHQYVRRKGSIEIGFISDPHPPPIAWLLIFWVNGLGSKCIWLLQDGVYIRLVKLDFAFLPHHPLPCLIFIENLFENLRHIYLHVYIIDEAIENFIFVYHLNGPVAELKVQKHSGNIERNIKYENSISIP